MNNITIAIINTLLCITTVPCLGILLNCINNGILSLVYHCFGNLGVKLIGNWLTFVGVIHHELSHALAAIITGAKIVSVDLFKPSGNTLGNVVFQPRGNILLQSIQVSISAIAPVFSGIFSVYILLFKVLAMCNNLGQRLLVIYFAVSILLHSTMSGQDIKIALKGLPICALIIFIIMLITKFNIFALSIK